jgi:hypothetical protein
MKVEIEWLRLYLNDKPSENILLANFGIYLPQMGVKLNDLNLYQRASDASYGWRAATTTNPFTGRRAVWIDERPAIFGDVMRAVLPHYEKQLSAGQRLYVRPNETASAASAA